MRVVAEDVRPVCRQITGLGELGPSMQQYVSEHTFRKLSIKVSFHSSDSSQGEHSRRGIVVSEVPPESPCAEPRAHPAPMLRALVNVYPEHIQR